MIQNAEYENNLNVCLELPEWLYYEREDELLIHAAIRHNNVVRIKETFSRFHNLYDSIASARFNLYSAFNEKVVEDLTNDEDNELWIQIQFISNAIQWYNNSFDVLLQSLWIYYGIYKNDCKTKKKLKMPDDSEVVLTTEALTAILSSCDYNIVRMWLLTQENPLHNGLVKLHGTLCEIRNWANTFKHRGNISFLNKSIAEPIVRIHSVGDETKVWYNSTDAKVSISICHCVNELINYHKSIIELSKMITDEFKLYFRK